MKKAILIALGVALLALGQTAEAAPTMHNCPNDGQWAISVWTGDTTDAGEALATCNIQAAYALTSSGKYLRYFTDAPEINSLKTLNKYDGVIALGGPTTVVPESIETSGTLPVGCTIHDLEVSVLSVGEGDHLGHTGLHAKPLPVVDGTTATKLQSQMAKAVEFCLYCNGEFIQCVPAPDVSGDGHLYTYSVEVVGDQYEVTYPVGHEYIRFDCGKRDDGSIFYCRISSSQSIPFNPTCPTGDWKWEDDKGFWCEGYPDAVWKARRCNPGESPVPGETYCLWYE